MKRKIAIYTTRNGKTEYLIIGTETIEQVVTRIRKDGGSNICIFTANIEYWGL